MKFVESHDARNLNWYSAIHHVGFTKFTRIGCKARVAKEIMMHYKPMVPDTSIIVGTTIAS